MTNPYFQDTAPSIQSVGLDEGTQGSEIYEA